MAFRLENSVKVTSSSTGSGVSTINLGSAVSGFRDFTVFADGDTTHYLIVEGSNREVGIGTIGSTGTTLTRNTILWSTNSSTMIALSGTAVVGCAPLAQAISGVTSPQGRLTLTTATPVLTSTVSGATTVYYTPYVGQRVPLYDGYSLSMADIGGELSQATTDATKSPAACTTNSNYDLFVWSDSGTYRCTRGPAWTSDTARGTGAGTTELQRINGILTNKVAITNGPVANRGTYVGTIRTNGSSQVDWILGGTAAGGTPASLHLWNMYNGVDVTAEIFNSVASYTWAPGAATFRGAGGTNNMRASFVTGLQADAVRATYEAVGNNSNAWMVGVGMDRSTGFDSSVFYGAGTTAGVAVAERAWLGYHYAQAVEWTGSATSTFYGQPSSGATYGLYFSLKGKF